MKFLNNSPLLKLRRRSLRRDQTEAERLLWSRLKRKQLGGLKFYRQFSVGHYILDFYCFNAKLAIELDGSQHLEPSTKRYDDARTEYLESLGVTVLRFWNNEVMTNMNGVLETIQAVALERMAEATK
ncbi:MAG: endonuclease domain-containing protein [Candidatus Komeilibacteria bacterium]|nr:endonuclease domain-containing protein [Candidatus Komeilibacteria bacterium]